MISLIVLSLILMLLRYRPIDHVSHIIGQARARLPAPFFLFSFFYFFFTKAPGPLVICSNRTVSPSGGVEEVGGEEEEEGDR